MQNNLSSNELVSLVQSVFSLCAADRQLAILIDVPDDVVPDTPEWLERRIMAKHWYNQLMTREKNQFYV